VRALEIMGRIDVLEAEVARCPDCGNPISDSDHFCSVCGSTLVHDDLCASCRSHLDPDDRFCAVCGHLRSTVAQAPVATSTSSRQEVLP
jgi:predicted amidophosphoribosyltransferase